MEHDLPYTEHKEYTQTQEIDESHWKAYFEKLYADIPKDKGKKK